MKVQITHMKAPWPQGAVVGDVVEVPEVPAWALGKCIEVGDGVEVTLTGERKPESESSDELTEVERKVAADAEAAAKAAAQSGKKGNAK
jgi:hypothetical protein